MTTALAWAAMAALGALGALARFHVGWTVQLRWGKPFPLGTFAVNMTGSFVLGALTGLGIGGDAALIFGTGLLGGYTTFSTWVIEAERLRERDAGSVALTYLLSSLVLGAAAAGAGWALAGALS